MASATPWGLWVLERSSNDRFPYRLQIVRGGEPWLVLRVQDRWPAANRNIFCLREKLPPQPDELLDEMERVPIFALQRHGRRVSVVLDRKRYKRCDFLFLTRTYKDRPSDDYEQIFWMTQQSMRQRRPGARLVSTRAPHAYTVRIVSDERYPWRFPKAHTERGPLPAGDYALMQEDAVLAVVERKTLDNLLADFGIMPVLHQRLLELSAFQHHALVVEAPYEDFLNPTKVHHYTATFCAAAIAEIFALHPHLRVVFCANRKTAAEWTRNYFSAVWNLANSSSSLSSEAQLGLTPPQP